MRNKAIWKDRYHTTLCFCCLSLSSHTFPTGTQVACNQTPHPGGRKSNFTCHTHNRLFMQVGWRVLRCVYIFEYASLEIFVCLFGLCGWVVWARVLPKGISTKGDKHAHIHTLLWGWKEICVCVAFHLTEGHQWVILLKSTLGYLCRWQTRRGCLRTRLTGQCLMVHNWFYWPIQPAGCQCWFEAWQLRLTTTAVPPGLLLWNLSAV